MANPHIRCAACNATYLPDKLEPGVEYKCGCGSPRAGSMWLRDGGYYDQDAPIGETLKPFPPVNFEFTGNMLRPASGWWQPIETAPRDGTPILGWDGEECAVVASKWNEHRGEYTGWCSPLYDMAGLTPTHWLPLPEPPAKF